MKEISFSAQLLDDSIELANDRSVYSSSHRIYQVCRLICFFCLLPLLIKRNWHNFLGRGQRGLSVARVDRLWKNSNPRCSCPNSMTFSIWPPQVFSSHFIFHFDKHLTVHYLPFTSSHQPFNIRQVVDQLTNCICFLHQVAGKNVHTTP